MFVCFPIRYDAGSNLAEQGDLIKSAALPDDVRLKVGVVNAAR